MVEVRGVTKTFPGVVANDDVSIAFLPGEVHCLLGENGAGKSTLLLVLSGIHRPDAGRVLVKGVEVQLLSPADAREVGIGSVYQHSTLIPELTVVDNLLLARRKGFLLDREAALSGFRTVAADLGIDLDPRVPAGRLALGQQQQVEIVRALWLGSRVLLLDEPTSMLSPAGIVELGKVLLRLKEQGLAVVFVTHKLHEALDMADRITVLRQGRVAGTLDRRRISTGPRKELQDTILGLMFGSEAGALGAVAELSAGPIARRSRRALSAEVALQVADVSVRPEPGEVGVEDVSFSVRKGEIFGIAGVDGNGQRELAEAVAGQRPLSGGDIILAGVSVRDHGVSERQRRGLRYVTDDRLEEGTVSSLSVEMNLLLKRIGEPPFWRRGFLRRDAAAECATELVRDFDIRTAGIGSRAGTLSGGNLQKLVLARELSFAPQVVVYNKPTYGLDVKTTQAVRARIRALSERDGATAVLISTDLEELLDLCDRIAVLYRGRLTGVVENGPGAEIDIGRLMMGLGAAPLTDPSPGEPGGAG